MLSAMDEFSATTLKLSTKDNFEIRLTSLLRMEKKHEREKNYERRKKNLGEKY